MNKTTMLVAAAALAAWVGSANADITYDFSYSGSGISASGELVISSTPDLNFPGGYDILSISGQRNGAPITGLVPPSGVVSDDGGLYYDNVFYPSAPNLDYNGLYYKTAGGTFDVWYDNGSIGGTTTYYELTPAQVGTSGTAVTFTATLVPEPSTLILVLCSFPLLALPYARRRPRDSRR